MAHQRWTAAENERLRAIWQDTSIKVETFGEHFPGRQGGSIYTHGLRTLKLGPRGRSQDFDACYGWRCILRQLEGGPKTISAILKAEPGLKRNNVENLLKHRRGRLVYVCDWTAPGRSGRHMIWALGGYPDKPRPPTLSRAEIARRYEQNWKASDPERHEVWKERKRTRRAIDSGALVRRDIAASWF